MRRLGAALGGAAIVLAARGVPAQEFAWANSVSGQSYAVATDGAGNVYVTGFYSGTGIFGNFSLPNAGLQDVFVAKLDPQGNVVWAKGMGGADYDAGTAVDVDVNGNVYVAGDFKASAQFGSFALNSAGSIDGFVEKLDPNGTVLWAKRFGGTGNDVGEALKIDGSGHVRLAGEFSDTATFGAYTAVSGGDLDVFVATLDSDGNFIQAARLGGGSARDEVNAIAIAADGAMFVTGAFQNVAVFGSFALSAGSLPTYEAYVVKLDSGGGVAWARSMGGANSDYGQGVGVDSLGNVYASGYFSESADFGPFHLIEYGGDSDDVFLVKLDSAGTFLWADGFGGSGPDQARGQITDAAGNSYVTGLFNDTAHFGPFSLTAGNVSGDAFFVKVDSAGAIQWASGTRTAGGNASGWGVALGPTGDLIGTGWCANTTTFGPLSVTSSGTYVTRLGACGSTFREDPSYGRLLFRPLCARDASVLGQDVYDAKSLTVSRSAGDTYWVSSSGTAFTPVVADDLLTVNGVDAGLGPYSGQPGVPPYHLGLPIDLSLVPVPSTDVTSRIPLGPAPVTFELRDTNRQIYGSTAIYLIQDCGMWLSGKSPTTLHYVTQQGLPQFEVRYGLLSTLRGSHG